MPSPPKVARLSEPLRAELDRRLIANGFSDYYALSDWLEEHGFEIGKSALHSYGQGL